MAFSGQLNDLALSELIEFFCNQRKTGRLKVDYALAPGVFFIKDGDLVDAKVGALNGTDAVFFALTLPSASFDFNSGMLSTRRTINDSWASVVLEGLRRLDEGIMPNASDAFATEEEIDEATIEYLSCMENGKESSTASVVGLNDASHDVMNDAPHGVAQRAASDVKLNVRRGEASRNSALADASSANSSSADSALSDSSALPFSQTLAATGNSGGSSSRGKLIAACVVCAVVLICAVAAIPLSKRFSRSSAAVPAAAPAASQAATSAPHVDHSANAATANAAAAEDAAATAAAGDAAAIAVRRERAEREARLERTRKLQEARRADAAAEGTDGTETMNAPAAAAAPATVKPATGPKVVRVSIAYDEAGRVTQAAAVGFTPGAEAYASTAVRVARGRRFPAGKAGASVITIPIN